MASSLKSGPKTYLKVVKDSLCNEAEIKQGNDVEFVKQMEERGFDEGNFVFAGYENLAEPNTDPDHLNGNSEENVNTNPMSTNSEIQAEIVAKQGKNKKRNRRKIVRKWAAAKALAEVEAQKIVDESAESLEKAAAKALTEAIKALVISEGSLINDNWEPTSRVQANTHTCPLGSEATHITDWSSSYSTIWNCKHTDALTWKSLYLLDLNGDLFVFGSVEVPKISTEDTPQSYFPIVCGDMDVRDMRKMVADLVQDDDEQINDNLGNQFKKMLEDVFNGNVFGPVDVARISTESQSCQAMPIVGTPIVCGALDVRDMRKMGADLVRDDDEEEINENLADQFKKMLEVDVFNQEDNEFYENYKFYDEVSDDTGVGESSKDNSVHSQESSDGSFCIVKRLLRRNGYQAQY